MVGDDEEPSRFQRCKLLSKTHGMTGPEIIHYAPERTEDVGEVPETVVGPESGFVQHEPRLPGGDPERFKLLANPRKRPFIGADIEALAVMRRAGGSFVLWHASILVFPSHGVHPLALEVPAFLSSDGRLKVSV
jgi:hypothetical protein